MKIIITGCAGFIGANFTNYWLNRHADDVVVGIDSLTYAANLRALDELTQRKNFRFYKTDICDREGMARIFDCELPELVINFAAESHVDRSIENSRVFVETNVLGVQTLLDLCLKYGVKRFHQISTDEVYGDVAIDSDDEFSENSSLNPSSPYSASKAAADLLVVSYFKTHNLPVTISRSSNNYGKYQHFEKMIPKTIQNTQKGEPITVYGDGKNIRDWIYVDDHCRAIELIVEKGISGGVYNVGGGYSISNIQLVREILQKMGKSDDLITFVSDRKGHDRKYAMDCSKIESELGWKAETKFADGIRKTIAWYNK